MIDRLSGRIALVLATGALLLIIVVGWFVLVAPQQSKVTALDAQIGDAHIELSQTDSFLRSPSARQGAAQLARLRRVIPDDVQMSQILRQLAWTAGQARISIESITPQAVTPTTGAQVVPIQLSVKGGYVGITKFLHLLRTRADVRGSTVRGSGRLYAVDGINLLAGTEDKGVHTATMTLGAFVFGPAAAAPVAGADATTTETTTTGS